MFYLVGIGNKIEDINIRTVNIIEKIEEIYMEYYTSFYYNNLKDLEIFLNKKIKIAKREDIEMKIDEILINIKNKKENKDIALLVIGDPLSATTHIDILERCKEKGIDYEIINNISIFSLIGKTGLQVYKFGKTTSIPFFSEKFLPKTPIKVYEENNKINAHTLFLLDIDPINNNYLKISEALKFLIKTSNNEINGNLNAIVCSQLNTPEEIIKYGKIEDLIKFDTENEFKPPVCIIIPSKLHFMEEKFLKNFKI